MIILAAIFKITSKRQSEGIPELAIWIYRQLFHQLEIGSDMQIFLVYGLLIIKLIAPDAEVNRADHGSGSQGTKSQYRHYDGGYN